MGLMRELGVWLVLPVVLLGLIGCGDDDDNHRTPTATAMPTVTPTPECPLPLPFCGGDFPLNTALTTVYGPAWADVVLAPSNFLPCFGPYALCYYANCPVAPDGKVSACNCFEWFGPNFVLINGILNSDVWNDTETQCTADPASCQQTNGAPVCQAINHGTFYSNAARVSTFGFYRANVEPIGSMNCTDMPGPYAGCMTGPCSGPTMSNSDGTVTIGCDCPIYDGPYQIGQSDVPCDTSPTVWSAAYNANLPPPNPCDMVSGPCVPDAPQDQCGCPLYSSTTTLPPDSGVDCGVVCQEYNGCFKSGTEIELGYTCDATLCTSSDHALVFDACLGLQDCDLGEIFKAETAASCSCCASQLCHCDANTQTEAKIFALVQEQRDAGETPQCDINGTLCGSLP